jgi:hypothetical protein
MPMFAKHYECVPFGVLNAEGRSRVWEGTMDAGALGHGFFVRIHGESAGPTLAQATAMSTVLHDAASIRTQATPHLTDLLNDSDTLPSGLRLNADDIWDHLDPCFIEISSETDRDMVAERITTRIAIGYAIPWIESLLVHIETVDGGYQEVYAG